MKSFEDQPQFNPENKRKQRTSPVIERDANTATPSKMKKVLEEVKEKLSIYLKHKGLKIKEYLGQLNQEDFDKLLEFDFKEQLKDIPPIEGIFSPEEELAKIKSLPKKQKRKALATFKENLAQQSEALAVCRVFLERSIEFNHDVLREKLIELVEKFGAKYGFDSHQRQILEQLIDGYFENRRRVLNIRKEHTDNASLVSELSGLDFNGIAKFDVSIGPMSVDITTDGLNANRIYLKSMDVVAKLIHVGFAARSSHKKPIFYTVTNKSNIIEGRLLRGGTLIHEHEHQKNRLFREIFDRQIKIEEKNMLLYQYEAEKDSQSKRQLLEAFFRLKRQEGLQHAKDEVIAMKKDKAPYGYGFFFEKDGSPYDYLAHVRDWKKKKNDTLWQEVAKKVLVDEYRKIFESAVSSFDRLEKEAGYTRDEIIALFADKSLPEWPKTATRMLEHKGKNSL